MEQKIRRDRNMGSNLRRLRDQYGISQEKLCAEPQRCGCDIGRTAYAKYESGELNIKASVIIELRKFYNCSYDGFFAGLHQLPMIRIQPYRVQRVFDDLEHILAPDDRACVSFKL